MQKVAVTHSYRWKIGLRSLVIALLFVMCVLLLYLFGQVVITYLKNIVETSKNKIMYGTAQNSPSISKFFLKCAALLAVFLGASWLSHAAYREFKNVYRGWIGELLSNLSRWKSFTDGVLMTDMEVVCGDVGKSGKDSAQIDSLIVLPVAVIIIEVKNWASAKMMSDGSWRSLKRGIWVEERKNPVAQNRHHCRVIRKLLGSHGIDIPVLSLVVFTNKRGIYDFPETAVNGNCHIAILNSAEFVVKKMVEPYQKTYPVDAVVSVIKESTKRFHIKDFLLQEAGYFWDYLCKEYDAMSFWYALRRFGSMFQGKKSRKGRKSYNFPV